MATVAGIKLIGRSEELAQLCQSIKRGDLLTIVGPPGIGKTLLARSLVDTVDRGRLPGGAVFCELTEATSAADVCRVSAAALDLPLVKGNSDDLAEQLGRALAARGPALIVLDNVEQVAEQAAAIIDRWRSDSPDTSFVITSRVRLHLDRERVISLGPLPEQAALDLFARRASRAREDFELGDHERAAVATLVAQLDGNPLAIELAAARMSVLTPRQLLDYLPDRLDALGHRAGANPRHASLEAALDWSWKLLNDAERAALAQLAVFRGGFTVDAASAVLDSAGGADVLDVLQSLRDKSLIQSRTEPATPDELRLTMFVGVREYAARRGATLGVTTAAERRHADYFARRAGEWAQRFEATSAPDAGARLRLELDNMLAAHRRCLASDDAADAITAIHIALAAWPLLARTGPYGLRFELIDSALAAAPGELPPALRARALLARGEGLRALERMEHSIADLERADALARKHDDPDTAARATCGIGLCHVVQGNFAECQANLDRSLELARAIASPLLEGRALAWLGHLDVINRDFERGWQRYGDALALLRAAGDRRHEGIALAMRATIAQERGHMGQAEALYETALELHEEVSDSGYAAIAQANLGLIAQECGDNQTALRRFERGIALGASTGDRRVEGVVLGYYARLKQCMQPAGRALRSLVSVYDRSLELLAGRGDPFANALVAAFRASVEADLGNTEAASLAAADAVARLADTGHQYAVSARLCAIHVDIGRARAAATTAEHEATELLARARAAIADIEAASRDALRSSADGRISLRLVRTRIAEVERALEPAAAPPPGDAAPTLTVASGARWFRLPTGKHVSLERRKPLRRILDRLVEARVDEAEAGLSVEVLKQAGWPGETIDPESARRRVYTALWNLRKLGLDGILTREDDGYRLRARIEIADQQI